MGLFGYSLQEVETMKARGDLRGLTAALGYQKAPQVQWAAMVALTQFGAPATPVLKAALSSGDPFSRKIAAIGLGQFGDPSAVVPLRSLIYDPDRIISKFAALALGNYRDPAAAGKLGQVLADSAEPPQIRKSAATLLGEIGTDEARNALVRASYAGLLPEIDDAILTAMVKSGQEKAIEALLLKLREPAGWVPAKKLDQLGWKPGSDSDGAAYHIVRGQWDRCAEIGAPAVDQLILLLRNQDEASVKAAAALGKIGDPRAIGPLAALLPVSNVALVAQAAEALGLIGSALAIIELAKFVLQERDRKLPERQALRQKSVEALRQACTKDRQALLQALYADYTRSVPIALDTIGWKHDVREEIVCAFKLGREERLPGLGEPAIQPLVDLLKRGDWLSESAGKALVKFGAAAIGPLTSLLADPDPKIAVQAARPLAGLGWQPDGSPAGVAFLIALERWEEVAAMGTPAIDRLTAVVREGNEAAKPGAVTTLGRIGTKAGDEATRQKVAEALVPVLPGTGSDRLRSVAADTLEAMGWVPGTDSAGIAYLLLKGQYDRVSEIGEPAVGYLIEACRKRPDPGTIGALGQIGDHRAINLLLPLLKSRKELRVSAAAALVQIFRAGRLDDAEKKAILSWRTTITSEHVDHTIHGDCEGKDSWLDNDFIPHTDESRHDDWGIGIAFPL